MSEETPTKSEQVAEIFYSTLQEEEDVQHAFQVLLTVIVKALDGNSIKAKMNFIDHLVEHTGVGPAIKQARMNKEMMKPAIKPETETQHRQLVYLAGWNLAERESN